MSIIDENKIWTVWRQDTHGNIFKMREGLTAQEAKDLISEFEAKGHKQHYWAKPKTKQN